MNSDAAHTAREMEPRARDVVAAAAGETGFDPCAVWERAVSVQLEPPVVFTPSIAAPVEAAARRIIGVEQSERPVPPEVLASLRQNTPQAQLRDLDRPGPLPPAMLELRDGTQVVGQWETARRALADAMRRQPAPRVIAAVELIAEEQERQRHFFAGPWQPAMPDDAPRRPVELYLTPSE